MFISLLFSDENKNVEHCSTETLPSSTVNLLSMTFDQVTLVDDLFAVVTKLIEALYKKIRWIHRFVMISPYFSAPTEKNVTSLLPLLRLRRFSFALKKSIWRLFQLSVSSLVILQANYGNGRDEVMFRITHSII